MVVEERMTNWKHTVRIKHLLTFEEDPDSVVRSMYDVGKELEKHECFYGFSVVEFFRIPIIVEDWADYDPVSFANTLLDDMYDYADRHQIWIE